MDYQRPVIQIQILYAEGIRTAISHRVLLMPAGRVWKLQAWFRQSSAIPADFADTLRGHEELQFWYVAPIQRSIAQGVDRGQ